ncbi:MAG: hypothetical protein KC478_14770 [Bacteriovoracaceae bacterium]|nr:hypothetical protein [Bacteriovoracaceae bacterium]
MRAKLLVALAALFSTTTLYAYCSSGYQLSRSASELERDAIDVSREARRYGMHQIMRHADQLAYSASHIEDLASSYASCYVLKSQYSRTVQRDYKNLQNTYQRNGDHHGNLSREMRNLSRSFRNISNTVRFMRDDYYEPVPRYPGRYDPPRPRHPRHTPAPHPGNHRRYDPPTRRRGSVSIPAGRHRDPRRAPRRRG